MGVKKPGAGGPGAAAALGGGTATSTGNEAIDKACREARDLAEQLQQQMTQAERSRVTERQQLVDKLETRDAEIKSIKEKNASVSYYYCYYYIKQKWSKNIDDRPHRRGGRIFHGRQCDVAPTSRESCSRLQQSRCHAVVKDWMMPFAAYTAADSQCF